MQRVHTERDKAETKPYRVERKSERFVQRVCEKAETKSCNVEWKPKRLKQRIGEEEETEPNT